MYKLTVMQELIERLYSGFFNNLEKQYYLEKEEKQIKDAFIAGYQCAKMEEMIGSSVNKYK